MEIEIIEAKCYLLSPALQKVLAASVYNPTEARLYERAKRYRSSKSYAVFAAVDEEGICGVIAVDIASPHSVVILDFAVMESLRGRGIGSALVRHLQEEFHPAEICAETDDDAVGFYQKFGFEVQQHDAGYQDIVRYQCVYRCKYKE